MDIDLDQARRQAKELLSAARAQDPAATARMRADRPPRLADAQRAVAVELGFTSWPALVEHVAVAAGDRATRQRRLVVEALAGNVDRVEALLEHDPALAGDDLAVALVLGDVSTVQAALDRRPQLIAEDVVGADRRPLSCACHSACLRPGSGRADAVLATIELLLGRGADPDEVHHNVFGAMSALYGAAGVAHNPDATRLLLARGANPDDGESVYHAVTADDTTCLEILLEAGATVRGTNALGNTIRDVRKVRVLLERGDLRPPDPGLDNALLHAIDNEVAELLIGHGADLEARDRDGLTAYSRAVRRGDPSLMELLASHGARTDADTIAEWIGGVLRGVVPAEPRPELVSVLRASDGELLPIVASAGEDVLVERLLDAGLPLDARGVDDGSALHYAAMWAQPSTVMLLLARGADVALVGGPQHAPSTALGWAAWASRALPGSSERGDAYVAVARLLVDAGAEVSEAMIDNASDDVAELLDRRRAPG